MSSIVTKNVDPATVPTPATGKTAFGTNLSSQVFIKDDDGDVTVITSGGTVTSVAVSSTDGTIDFTGSPITTSGTIDLSVDEAALNLANIGGDLDLTTQVTGALGIVNGGTGATTATGAINALLPNQTGNSGEVLGTDGTNVSWVAVGTPSPLTTKGDLYTYTTTEARLPVGTNGQVLAADSAEATGLKWIAPPAGGVTSVDVSGGTTGLSFTGGPITTSGTITLSGVLDIDNGGTGESNALDAFGALSPMTTNGDLITQAAGVPTRLPVGTDGQVLKVVSGAPAWGAASGSPAGSNTEVQFNNSGSFGASSDFTWNSTNRDLQVGTLIINAGAPTESPITIHGTDADTTAAGVIVRGGDDTGTDGEVGALLSLGSGTSTNSGNVLLSVGDASGAGHAVGSITIETGTASDGAAVGNGISLSTAGNTRLRINANGSWSVGGGSGTSGQVLTSNGASASPSWTTVSSGSGTVTSVDVSGGTTGLSFTGGPVTTSGTITAGGTLAVANGGTGLTTLTANNVILGNGTSAPSFVAPGTSGNVLTSNGTTWTSEPAAGGSDPGYIKQPVRAATTANVASLSGNVVLDGITTAPGDRILVKNQTTASQNGIYVAAAGAWSRAADFDTGAFLDNGCIVAVGFGTANGGSVWQLSANGGTIGNSFRFMPVGMMLVRGQSVVTTAPLATGASAIAIGSAASAGNTNSISIGPSASANANGTVQIGVSATAGAAQDGIAIGNAASFGSGTNKSGAITVGVNSGNPNNVTIQHSASFGSGCAAESPSQFATAPGFFSNKLDAIVAIQKMWMTTTTDTTTELKVAANSASSATPTGVIFLANDSSYIFDCDIIARNTATDTESKAFNLKFAIRSGAAAANTALIGSATKTVIGEDSGTSTWDVTVTADTTNGRPNISVTGEAAKTIRWVANIRMTKVTG
jgi:hypothetical protein